MKSNLTEYTPSNNRAAAAVGSVYGVDALAVSRAGVGSAVWCSFAGLVRGVLGL